MTQGGTAYRHINRHAMLEHYHELHFEFSIAKIVGFLLHYLRVSSQFQ